MSEIPAFTIQWNDPLPESGTKVDVLVQNLFGIERGHEVIFHGPRSEGARLGVVVSVSEARSTLTVAVS